MQVVLSKRLGQNPAGTTVQVSDSEGAWLMHRGYATHAPTTTHTTEDSVSSDHDVSDHVPTPTPTTRRKR